MAQGSSEGRRETHFSLRRCPAARLSLFYFYPLSYKWVFVVMGTANTLPTATANKKEERTDHALESSKAEFDWKEGPANDVRARRRSRSAV